MPGLPEPPLSVERWELEAYLHGDADEALVRRIQNPALNAEVGTELKSLQAEHSRLQVMLDRLDCPSPDELRDLAWHALPPDERNRIERHLHDCQGCAAEFVQLSGPRRHTSLDKSSPKLLQSFEQGFRILVAQLVSADSMPTPVLRGDGDMALTYQVPQTDWEVSVETQHVARGYALTGQIFGPATSDLASSRASLLNKDMLLQEVDVEATGWFTFNQVTQGAFKIWVESPTFRIQLPMIELGLG